MGKPLTENLSVRLSTDDVRKIGILQNKLEEENYNVYSYSDIIRICIRATYKHEIENKSLNISLTNTS